MPSPFPRLPKLARRLLETSFAGLDCLVGFRALCVQVREYGFERAGVRMMFDEMTDSAGAVRPAYTELSQWLAQVPPDVLDYRRREAELLFRRIGITFAVYGDPEAQERLIPFDVIPRIISAKEWDLVQRGLRQRVTAVNAYIKDVY